MKNRKGGSVRLGLVREGDEGSGSMRLVRCRQGVLHFHRQHDIGIYPHSRTFLTSQPVRSQLSSTRRLLSQG